MTDSKRLITKAYELDKQPEARTAEGVRRCAGGAGTPPLAGGRPRAAVRGGVNTGGRSQHAAPLGPGTLRGVPRRVPRPRAALRCVSRVYSRGSPRSTRCGTFIVFVCVPDRMHQLTQSSEPQGPQMHTRRAHTRPRPPPTHKRQLATRDPHPYAFSACSVVQGDGVVFLCQQATCLGTW